MTRGKIITILIAMLVVVGAVTLAVTGLMGGKKSLTSLSQYAEPARNLELTFYNASRNLLKFEEVFTDEFAETMVQELASAEELLEVLNTEDFIKQLSQHNATDIKEKLERMVPLWRESINMYLQVFEAYKSNNVEFFDELQRNENSKIATVGGVLYNYYWFERYDQQQMSANNCGSSESEICSRLQANIESNTEDLKQDAQVVMTLFSAYDTTLYTNNSLIGPRLFSLTSANGSDL